MYLEGRKLAGVLTEFTSRAEAVDHAVVGVGLNVNQEPKWLAGLDQPGISLRAGHGPRLEAGRALGLGAGRDERALTASSWAAGPRSWAAEYAGRSLILGLEVTVREGQQVRQGRATGFAPSGALLLEEDGVVSPIHHGDVSLLAWEGKA